MEFILQQIINGLSAGMSYALVALGLTLVFGVLHIINFAHGELYLLGGLTVAILCNSLGWPYWAAIGAAGVVAIIGGALVEALALRKMLARPDGHDASLLSTYAASLLILELVIWGYGPAPQRIEGVLGGLQMGTVALPYQRLVALAGGAVLLLVTEMGLRFTAIGRDLRAIAQDGFAARVIGIDVDRARTLAFLAAAGLAGLAGALTVPITLFTPMMGQHVIIKAYVVVVIGGMGSVVGAVVCGLAIGLLEVFLRSWMIDGFAQMLIYVLLVLVLLVRPQGLLGGRR